MPFPVWDMGDGQGKAFVRICDTEDRGGETGRLEVLERLFRREKKHLPSRVEGGDNMSCNTVFLQVSKAE